MNIYFFKWICLLQNRNQHSTVKKGKEIKVYYSTEEDRVNEDKTRKQNYLERTNMEKRMSHLAISPSRLLIQHLNFMAIAPWLPKTHYDKSQFGWQIRKDKSSLSEVSDA